MDVQAGVLLRFDSWSRPGLKETDILRTTSFDQEKEHSPACESSYSASREPRMETRALLCTTQKHSLAKPQKAILQIDVQCTPSAGFDDLLRQLENPCLPAFKLTDLPISAKEDLDRMTSPCNEVGDFSQTGVLSLEEELASFPLALAGRVASDSAASSLATDDVRGCFYPNGLPARSLLLDKWLYASDTRKLYTASHNKSPMCRASESSDDRPAKRSREVSKEELHVPESSSETVGSTASRGKRLACLKCGTHQTPQWRMGPDGPRTMCNACGVKYKKELKEREKKNKLPVLVKTVRC